MLFLIALFLRKLAKTESDIPAPHWIEQFAGLVNRILRIPTTEEDTKVAGNNRCQYTSIAYAINNTVFVVSALAYFIAITVWFIL